MSASPDSTLDPQQVIADLKRQLAESNAERDEALEQLIERTAERDEALEQQTATAGVLQVINSSPGDLKPVFEAMLDKALQLCGAAFGALHTIDGERRHIAAHRGVSPVFAEFLTGRSHEFSKTGPGLIGQLLRGERVIHHDAAESEAYRLGAPMARALVELEGGRTLLAVPLSKDNALLGMVVIYRREVRPFSERQIALLQNFADQAVIAMENARLITETREALEQQTATAEVLQVINSSPGDLTPVFDAILEKAHSLCGVTYGSLQLYDGETLRAVATRGYPEPLEKIIREPYTPVRGGPLQTLIEGGPLTQIRDITEYNTQGPNPRRRVAAELGIRTLLFLPLRKDNLLLGIISADRTEARLFSDRETALLENFAAQAVIAMENARLITETREALEQQTATAEVLQVINSSPGDLTPVFDAMLVKATRLCEAAAGTFWVCADDEWSAAAVTGMPEQFVKSAHAYRPTAGSPVGRIVRGERLVHIPDLAAEEVYQSGDALIRAAVDRDGIRTLLSVPLRKENKLLGVFSVYRRDVRPFTDKHIALVQNFAAQAVIAMENARLINETREALEQQTATAEVLQVINSSPGDLAPVFDAILEKAHSLCGATFGGLLIYDGDRFKAVALHNVPPAFAEIAKGFLATPHHPIARLLEGEPLVHIADLKEIAEVAPTGSLSRAGVDLAGIRTLLLVPLRKGDALLGVITAYRQEVCPFSDKQIALLQNFAAQAVIAIENARLITETQEALEQQTATAEVLQVINSSPGDLAPVFDTMLKNAMRLCQADCGHISTYDGDLFHWVALQGNPAFVELVRQRPSRSASSGPVTFTRLIMGEEVVHVLDCKDTDAYRTNPIAREGIERANIRTLLTVGLRKEDILVGALSVYRQEVRPFTKKQIALLQNFAGQAVIAMENARLLGELRQRTDEVAELNRGLEARVAEQVDELGRVGRLKRFLAPQLAELIVSHGDEKILESHRREIVVVFCDLRGYTAFTETAEPEEVLNFLREYHGALGPLVSQFEGTLDQFSGDGIMVFFNDPVPCPDPAERAVKMAIAMREAAGTLIAHWRERGRDLGFGAGIAQGYATLGQIGFSERSGYTAIGTVCNVAARLCAEAKDGQILLGQLVNVALKGSVATEQLGPLALKGLSQPVVAYNVPLGASQPALRVIEGGPQSV